MESVFLSEILKLKNSPYVNKETLEKFITRVQSKIPYTKTKSKSDHFGSFLLPVNKSKRLVYFGFHIKANSWLPPGGHIEEDESPETAMRREFREELGQEITHEKVELFNISTPYYENHQHYDFWYLIHTDIQDFAFDSHEFTEMKWISVDDIPNYMNVEAYMPTVYALQKYLR